MASDEAAIHERMMWFWHTDFTTSGKMGNFLMLWRQLRTLHQHAMGDLRSLARALVVDLPEHRPMRLCLGKRMA